MANTAPDFTEMLFELEVWDLKHLNRLISPAQGKVVRSAGAQRDYRLNAREWGTADDGHVDEVLDVFRSAGRSWMGISS